ncbi:alpha-1,6-mannosyltransferase [Jatrophihabitans endophyticus]|uniref:Alpha-1,6-mannosyltransferase n=1 Tax=Jatrophihabitans endophyticus TaxID=1206085 RepID=A0A1M5RVJ9_9ACTN|nr:polyprenol phosphomannose-dependent alpha 1,6 mannosyltransferase MptB [Jatrophihabitans endophyticus]SHH30325.1 alpha-1,6-mannosyltransferase [Jatrophihabitans endophyticus]
MTTSRRAAPLLGGVGVAAAVTTAVAAGHAYTASSVPPTRWWGLLAPGGVPAGVSSPWAVLLWAGITALSACWLLALRAARRGALTERQARRLVVLSALPLVLGPPAVSRDVYAYAAQGVMLRHGLDVYGAGPAALAGVPGADAARALAAVDARWRDSPSPYGPVTTALARLAGAISGGDPTIGLVVFRAVAALSVGVLVWACVSLAAPRRRTQVLVLVGLNPLVLVHALSAAHVEAPMCALLALAVLAGRRRVWWAAIVLACLAGLVKAPAFLAVPVVLAWHLRALDEPHRRLGRAARDVAVAVATVVATSLAVPDGFGWLRNLGTPGGGKPSSSVTGQLAALADGVVPGGRAAVVLLGAVAALAVLVVLAAGFGDRPPAESLGWALLAVAFLAPVTYPWYALWGLVCLLPTVRGRPLAALVALCVVEAGLSIPGGAAVSGPLVGAVVAASVIGLVLVDREVRVRAASRVANRRPVRG